MDARQRWQALQSHLSAARLALDRGDKIAALRELDAALAIDPEFAAARALRERIDVPDLRAADAGGAEEFFIPTSDAVAPDPSPVLGAAPRPLVSAEGFARFEERARRRRIDRRADAARRAIAEGRLREAAVAIDEIRDLDPNAPEIGALDAALSAGGRARAGRRRAWHVGPQLAAAVAFAAIVLASWVEQPRWLLSYPISIVTALVSTVEPSPLVATASAEEAPVVGTSGDVAPSDDIAFAPRKVALTETPAPSPHVPGNSSLTDVAPLVEPAPPPAPAVTNTSATPSVAPPVVAAAMSSPAPVPVAPSAAPPPPSSETATVVESKPPDDALVRRALQQYKTAYEALDARSAQAVWPVVNERALARAFDGLQSQNLTFDACDVQVTGDLARATCRGTARYVAKVGSREPRIEPRTWSFTLRRSGPEWKIETARADR